MSSLVLAAEDAEVALDQLGAHPPPVEQRGGALAVAQHRRRRSRRRRGVVVVVADGLGLDDVFLVVVVGRLLAPLARRFGGAGAGGGGVSAAASERVMQAVSDMGDRIAGVEAAQAAVADKLDLLLAFMLEQQSSAPLSAVRRSGGGALAPVRGAPVVGAGDAGGFNSSTQNWALVRQAVQNRTFRIVGPEIAL